MTADDEVTDVEAMTAGLRGRGGPWPNLQRVWPDAHDQLGGIYDGVTDAVISVGADDWTERDQLEHFIDVRSQVDDLGSDLDRIAHRWEDGTW